MMPFHPCPLGFLSSVNGHDRCLQCLDIQHAEAAFVDGSCFYCEHMTIATLRSRLSFLKSKGADPSATTRPGFSATSRGPPAGALDDLRVTVRASLPDPSPRTSHSSLSDCPVRFLSDLSELSCGGFRISFGAPQEDQMSIRTSGDGLSSSEDEDSAGLPPRVLLPLPN